MYVILHIILFFLFKQKTAYEMRISDWSSDVCSSDLLSTATRGMRFNWRRVVMKDYSTASAWLTAALVLFAYEAVYDFGLVAAQPRLAAAAALLVLSGRASCRERVCQYVQDQVVAVYLKKKIHPLTLYTIIFLL